MVFFVRNRPNIEGDVLPLDFPSVWREISSNANTLPQTDGISEEIDILTSVRFRDVTMLTSPEFLSFFGQTYRQLTANQYVEVRHFITNNIFQFVSNRKDRDQGPFISQCGL